VNRIEGKSASVALAALLLGALAVLPASADEVETKGDSVIRHTQDFLDLAGLNFTFAQVLEIAGRTHSASQAPALGGLTDVKLRWQPRTGHVGSLTATYSVYSRTRDLEAPDLQGVSNIAAGPFHRWREVFYEVPLLQKLRVKVGKVDANTEFAVVERGADLSHASAGASQTLFTMPSYPDGALSANAFFAPGYGTSVGVGIYRLAGGGLYLVSEAGARWKRRLEGRLAIGFWKQRDSQTVGSLPESSGSYFVIEQRLIRRGSAGLDAFARVSIADAAVAPASLHNLYGVVWSGIGTRKNDSAGLAYMRLLPSANGVVLKPETVYESYYKLPLTSFLDLKMDFQHVRLSPSEDRPPCFAVASVRFLFSYSAGRKGE